MSPIATKLSFVIPCYRSEQTIAGVVREIRETVAGRPEYDYEILLVNDSSPDGVFDVIRQLCREDPRVKGIDLARNFGQHAALMTGFRHVTGDIVVCLDDDGQTPPCEMFALIDRLEEGVDIVIASYPEKKHSPFRNMGSKVNDWMARTLIGKPKNLALMSYFCCRRFIIEEIIRYQNPYPYIDGLLLRSSNRIVNVPIEHRDRLVGESGYTLKKLIGLWFNGFTAFSVKPLRIATVLGFICALIGFIYGLYTVISKLFIDPNVPVGYSALMSVLVFLGGMMLLMLGLIGEYIGRIYISINNSPQAVIRSTVNLEGDENENA